MNLSDDLLARKAECRQRALGALSAFLKSSPLIKAEAESHLGERLIQVLGALHGKIALFRALETEPDCFSILHRFLQWELVFPVIEGAYLHFFKPLSPAAWRMGPWGILQPDPTQSEKVPLEDCQAILVPGVAFDRSGVRLGRGRGFYDRILETFEGLKIGVAFGVQVVEDPLPHQAHDIPMNVLVTEQYILQVKG